MDSRMMDGAARSLCHAVRTLARDKGFSLTVMLTLGACIAANTAIFAVVHSVLLRPLPVAEADRILLMANRYPKAGVEDSNHSGVADYYDRLREMTVFERQALFTLSTQTVDLKGTPERITGMAVTPSLFALLRAQPGYGRAFAPEEGEVGAEQKAILSHGLARQLYGSADAAVGREIRLSARPYTIVGVMAPGFSFVNSQVRLWIPLAFPPEQKDSRHSNNWHHIGRLKPGASLEQAQAQVDALNRANLDRFPQWREVLTNAGFHTKVMPLREMLTGGVRSILFLLWGGALLVLLIGALNVANLALARLSLRRKELATRLAIGAGRWSITRQMLTENVLLAVAGGCAGVAGGEAIVRLLRVAGMERLPRAEEVSIDWVVIAAALALSAGAGLLMTLPAALQAFGLNLAAVLHENSRTGSLSPRARAVRRVLVVGQVGFAFVLLAGAGLLLTSFFNLLRVDPGFDPRNVLTVSTVAPRARYGTEAQLRTLMNRSLEGIRRLPGVTAAGATDTVPLNGNYSDSVILAEGYVMQPGESVVSPRNLRVTPGYLEAMNVRLARGRYFEERDHESSERAILVDEAIARRFWPGQDPIGRRMYQPSSPGDILKFSDSRRWLRVVGVVRSVRLENLEGKGNAVGAYYVPYAQNVARSYTFAIRANGDPDALARAVRAELARIDPELAVFDTRTMAQRMELSLEARRTSMTLALGFGGLALFLAAVGIYGVLAYLISRRRREIGIRLALGSTSGDVMRLVLREGFLLVGAGLTAGFAGAVAMRRALENEIYGVGALDPAVLGGVAGVLAVVALTACAQPARQAMRVNPAIVLSDQ